VSSVVGTITTPFGNPDGARENLDVLLAKFVDFAGSEAFGALATSANDMRARVIVGRMGAGKTVYLRRMQAKAMTEASVYADTSQSDLPSTESIVRTCQYFERRDLVEMWKKIWSRAIVRTVVAHVLRRRELREHVEPDLRDELARYEHLIGVGRAPGTIYSHLADMLYEHDARHKLTMYLHHRDWSDLTYFVGEAIWSLPPIAFYVDGVDESFGYAPMYWLPCQEGLFHAVMQSLRDPKIGGRLHVVVTIRDVVFSSVLRSETASKYRGEPHIRVLDWDARSLYYFLIDKIGRLDDRYRADPEAADAIANWLGHSTIDNIARGRTERTADYIIRHTRMIPRDLVHVGNALCSAVIQSKLDDSRPPTQEAIRRTVAIAAAAFGNDQLQQCADQISADMAPQRSSQHGYADYYIGGHGYIRDATVEKLREGLLLIGVDRFDGRTLQSARELLSQQFDGQSDFATVLWQNGLLGFVGRRNGGEGTFFYSMSGLTDLQPPLSEREYVLHPCLIDAVGLRAIGARPVYPFQ
jgi:hypothetical protein